MNSEEVQEHVKSLKTSQLVCRIACEAERRHIQVDGKILTGMMSAADALLLQACVDELDRRLDPR